MEPFRFVHCARLSLDHQLRGTGPVPDSIRPIVEDATLLAWENVVQACLRERVDLLLIAGNSLEQADHSLRGAAAVLRGLERLAEHDVLVVISAGAGDPWESWPVGLRWPRNVARLDSADEIPVVRDGRLLAIVKYECDRQTSRVGDRPRSLKFPSVNEPPFHISLSDGSAELLSPDDRSGLIGEPGDPDSTQDAVYHATGGGATARTVVSGRRVMHDPGPAQAICPSEAGPRGCTLVVVEADGQWRRTFVPTAPVRFEQVSVAVTPQQTRDDVLLEMLAALEQLPRYDSDQLWLIAWNITGQGTGVELLRDSSTRQALLNELQGGHGIRGVRIETHAVRLPPVIDVPHEAEPDELLSEFDRRLFSRLAQPQWALQKCLDESRLHDGPWESPLRSLLAEVDAREIAPDARQVGRQWFAMEEALP